jgi:hypothetical protein
MIYSQGQYLKVDQRYVASFVNGLGAIVAGKIDPGNILLYEKGIPWIKDSTWTQNGSYGDWTFTCAIAIDAQALGVSLGQVLSTFDPLSGWEFTQMADPGQGRASNSAAQGCGIDNIDACFGDLKTFGYIALAGLALIVVIKLT